VLGAPETRGGSGRGGVLRIPETRERRSPTVVVPLAPWVFGSAAVAMAYLPGVVKDHLAGCTLVFSAVITLLAAFAGIFVQPLARRVADGARLLATSLVIVTMGMLIAFEPRLAAGSVRRHHQPAGQVVGGLDAAIRRPGPVRTVSIRTTSVGGLALRARRLDVPDRGAVGAALDVGHGSDAEAVGAHADARDHAAYGDLSAGRGQAPDDVVDLVFLAVDVDVARPPALGALADPQDLRRAAVERDELADLQAHVAGGQHTSERPVVIAHETPPRTGMPPSYPSPIAATSPLSVHTGISLVKTRRPVDRGSIARATRRRRERRRNRGL
jgi:hypothetical protein